MPSQEFQESWSITKQAWKDFFGGKVTKADQFRAFATILICSFVKFFFSVVVISELRGKVPAWWFVFPGYAMIPSAVEIIYGFFFTAKRETRLSVFWFLRLVAFSSLCSAVAFFVLYRCSHKNAHRQLVTAFLALSILEFCVSTFWAMRFWRTPSIRTYAPVCNIQGRTEADYDHASAGTGQLSHLYEQLLLGSKQASDARVLKASTEKGKLHLHSRTSTNILAPASLPAGADFWLFRQTDHDSVNLLLFFLILFTLAHATYQVWQFVTIRRHGQICDWRCVYNMTYVWLYIPWVCVVSWMIKCQVSFSQPVVPRINAAHVLAAYFGAAFVLWVLALYTTSTQPHGYIRGSKVKIFVWNIFNVVTYCYKVISGGNFVRKALTWRDK